MDPARATAFPARPSGLQRARAATATALRALGLTQAVWLAALALRFAISPRDVARERAARTLGRLKGPFAKLGQLAGMRVDLLAPETRAALLALRDQVPPLPAWWVRDCVERELGEPIERAFARFEAVPLGAASIAQVHAAWLADGRPVAVKVQYPWLERSAGIDLALARIALWLVSGAAPSDAAWNEFARAYAGELDFRREAEAARAIQANLRSEPSVAVPRVIAAHSRARVLTTEWAPTLPIARDALVARGIAPGAVLEIIVRAYARQIFVDGLFHADPHAGNLFVLDEPSAPASPRVLFVDFGLSRHLEPQLRRELRAGILALLNGKLEDFLAGMRRLGTIAPGAEAGVRDAVAAMFARIRGESGSALALSGERVLALKAEAQALLFATPGLALPADLLLYAKTVAYLFALGRELAPEVDVMKLAVPYLLRFVAERD